jgi:serpin B
VASDAYVKRLQQDYAAQVFRSAELEDVNGWVSRITRGKIDHIVDRPVAEGIVLIDAVYFNQAWRMPFVTELTRNDDFHLSPNSTIKVATMHQRDDFAIVSKPGFRAIRLPYLAESLSMVVILPDAVDGATALAQRLDSSELTELFVFLRVKKVYTDLSLPRFRTSFASKLKSKYQQLGLVKPFDEDRADFSGITGGPKERIKLWIDDIVHRAALEITENGTEAAAATATSMVHISSAGGRQPSPSVPFTVDRPFLFYITDDNTGAILFAGRVSDPSKTN